MTSIPREINPPGIRNQASGSRRPPNGGRVRLIGVRFRGYIVSGSRRRGVQGREEILRSEPLLASPGLEPSGVGFDSYGPNATLYALSVIAAGMLQ